MDYKDQHSLYYEEAKENGLGDEDAGIFADQQLQDYIEQKADFALMRMKEKRENDSE